MEEYDVVILGCGPAGLSAAIFCGRAELKTVVIGQPEKSQANIAMHIENYFGFPEGVDGPELLARGMEQTQKFGVKIIKEEAVTSAAMEELGKRFFVIRTSEGQDFRCRAMIIATGIPIRLSGIENEEKFTGRGVHYCVSCDGPLYKDKKLAIIGNSNHAAEDAIEALSYTKDITIISDGPSFDFASRYYVEIKKWNIKLMMGKVKEFKGDKFLQSLIFYDNSEAKFDGVFMACGVAGALDFAANLGLEIKDNVLVIDENNMTNMEGVFAAGNCAAKCRQIARNVGDGCNAAISIIKYLRSRKLYMDYVHRGVMEKKEAVTEQERLQPTPIEQPERAPQPEAEQPESQKTQKKLKIGWFSFSCCEDSTIVFTEILNDYYDKLKNVIDIRYSRILKKNNDMSDLDVAFVEGAVSNEKIAEALKKIRKNSKKLVAIGACAVTGMPSGQRNNFDERRRREIEPIIRAFDYSKKVQPLHELVKVDENVPGCPMTEAAFLNTLDKCFKEFGINAQL